MSKIGATILALCLASSVCEPIDEVAFANYITKYGRNYATKQEFEQRFVNFKSNLALVNNANDQNITYKLSLNEFADQSSAEFSSTHFGLVRPKNPWGGLKHLGTHKFTGKTLSSSVDWVAAGAVTNVKNQGQCGSCWSFSTTGALEGAWEVATGKLVTMSEQQLVDCDTQNNGCNGGSMDYAFQFFESHSVCTESSYPYTATDGNTCRQDYCTVAIPTGGVVGFRDVAQDNTQALMEALMQQPISIAIEADQSSFQLYSHGVLTKACGDSLDHGVLLVGYGSARVHGRSLEYWKVKNSWGPSWGEEGYIRLQRGLSGGGKCGLKMMASYPVVSSEVTV